ncbi:phosphopyruvate hydratase [Candidatus Mycoplasma haematohominis]|uniref:Enolase n=1 Tax=Candidatus Mycoplasma haematohominis TaxID=1494318 RepID=A0A478FTH7_9MOLU|nr:phosphopyruvate hydratase [Candidatus Mycoplasma haemohominis]GCE63330.1 enolase [Candidatus Mycoplasma haemohominis]
MAFKIENIFAYEILDSRGNPTVACIAKVSTGLLSKSFFSAKAMVPSGASTGEKEAIELRDGDSGRFDGKGVKRAVHYVNYVIATSLIENNIDPSKQQELDSFLIDLDGTENKGRYGANAILAVSLAVAKAVAKAKGMPFYQYIASLMGNAYPSRFILPLPMVNVINGGAHADNTIDFQEFMFMPVGAASMHEAVRISAECFHALQKSLKEKGLNTNKGDEGGFAPNLGSVEEVLDIMISSIERAGYRPGLINGQVAIALDVAASEFYDEETKLYKFRKAIKARPELEDSLVKTTAQMIDYYEELIEKYPIVSIEDPLDENDWDGFVLLMERLGRKLQIVGDDLFCTNPKITQEGVDRRVANAVLVKMNQIGTISETLKTIQIAKNAGWACILSHRSGETEDTSIADIAVGTSAGQIKTGSTSRSERIAKYNRLLEIEIELTTSNSVFYGLNSLFSLDFNEAELFKSRSCEIESIPEGQPLAPSDSDYPVVKEDMRTDAEIERETEEQFKQEMDRNTTPVTSGLEDGDSELVSEPSSEEGFEIETESDNEEIKKEEELVDSKEEQQPQE